MQAGFAARNATRTGTKTNLALNLGKTNLQIDLLNMAPCALWPQQHEDTIHNRSILLLFQTNAKKQREDNNKPQRKADQGGEILFQQQSFSDVRLGSPSTLWRGPLSSTSDQQNSASDQSFAAVDTAYLQLSASGFFSHCIGQLIWAGHFLLWLFFLEFFTNLALSSNLARASKFLLSLIFGTVGSSLALQLRGLLRVFFALDWWAWGRLSPLFFSMLVIAFCIWATLSSHSGYFPRAFLTIEIFSMTF